VLVSAYKSEPARRLVLVAINEDDTAHDFELKLAGVGAASAVPCRTSETEDLATLPEVRIADNTLKASLAPTSVTTFVAAVK
jgi:O-glycosyl hydrolase